MQLRLRLTAAAADITYARIERTVINFVETPRKSDRERVRSTSSSSSSCISTCIHYCLRDVAHSRIIFPNVEIEINVDVDVERRCN